MVRSPARSESIEVIRVLATVLLVAYHVVGDTPKAGLAVDYPSPWRFFADFFVDLRMPLFAFIAGYVYFVRPPGRDTFFSFLRGKVRRLLLPGLTAALIFAGMAGAAGLDKAVPVGKLWRILVFPYAHYWFLQSIFLLLIAVAILHAILRIDVRLIWAVAVIFSVGGWSTPLNIFSTNGAIYLAPFFLLAGVLRFVHIDRDAPGWGVRALLVVGLLATSVANAVMYVDDGTLSTDRRDLQSLMFGYCACLLLYWWVPAVSGIRRWSTYCYSIYLYHVIGTSATRRLLNAIGVETTLVVFIFCLAAGLLFPVLVHRVASRWRVTRLLVLGLRPHGAAPGTLSIGPPSHDTSGTPSGGANVTERPPG